jgi:hypothetical protein
MTSPKGGLNMFKHKKYKCLYDNTNSGAEGRYEVLCSTQLSNKARFSNARIANTNHVK